MWNHAEEMMEALDSEGLQWPQLAEQEMADIIAYVWSINRVAEKRFPDAGDPARGARLFERKGCAGCHTGDQPVGPALRETPQPRARTITGMAALMWNHYPKMRAALKSSELTAMPDLAEGDMADLIAFLFSAGYFDQAGDADRGRALFRDKRCSSCHERGAESASVVALRPTMSPITMAMAMWNHGPKMGAQMKDRDIAWPQLTRAELLDLIAFLR